MSENPDGRSRRTCATMQQHFLLAATDPVYRDNRRKIESATRSERLAARKSRDFLAADRIRDELARLGVQLEDRADGTIWRTV